MAFPPSGWGAVGAIGLLGLGVLLGTALPAASQNVSVRLLGAGTVSCGKWTAARKGDDDISKTEAAVYFSWAEGYLTAIQQALPEVNKGVRQTDADGLAGWLDDYCAAHSLDNLAAASQALALELGARGLRR
jgi:hypothetical protein